MPLTIQISPNDLSEKQLKEVIAAKNSSNISLKSIILKKIRKEIIKEKLLVTNNQVNSETDAAFQIEDTISSQSSWDDEDRKRIKRNVEDDQNPVNSRQIRSYDSNKYHRRLYSPNSIIREDRELGKELNKDNANFSSNTSKISEVQPMRNGFLVFSFLIGCNSLVLLGLRLKLTGINVACL